MQESDVTEKLLEDYNDVFADIVNTLIFDGEERITEDSLEDGRANSMYKAEDGRLHEQERDISKYWKEGRPTFLLLELKIRQELRNLCLPELLATMGLHIEASC